MKIDFYDIAIFDEKIRYGSTAQVRINMSSDIYQVVKERMLLYNTLNMYMGKFQAFSPIADEYKEFTDELL